MKAALNEQGFKGDNKRNNHLIAWERSERKALEAIINTYNFEREDMNAKYKHLPVEEFKIREDEKKIRDALKQKHFISSEKTTQERVRNLTLKLESTTNALSALKEEKSSPMSSFFYSDSEKQSFVQSKMDAAKIQYVDAETGFYAQKCYAEQIRKWEKMFKPSSRSFREKLQGDIDKLLMQCNDVNQLYKKLEKEGYTIKLGKYISVKHPQAERFIRLKTLGEEYNERALQNRIQYNIKFENELNAILPSAEPVIRDATDWQARFQTVRSTFSSRVGQISNAALNRSIIAYNENSADELRDKCREETETLAILTGLEIDSAKSGVKPDLTEYLGTKTVAKSKFLKYKSLLEKSEGRRAWYEPTFEEHFEKFFADTDWNKVDSNVERLPYLAYMLEKNTTPVVDKPADDSELFTFAADENWKDKLNGDKMRKLSALITDYERCLSRIRACGQPVKDRQRRNDIQRILYSRGQGREYDADMLYTLFQGTPLERITAIRQELQANSWHLAPKEQRDDLLAEWIPELERYYPLFSDFRFGGYRVLIDLIADIDDDNNRTDRKRLIRDGDSVDFRQLRVRLLINNTPIQC